MENGMMEIEKLQRMFYDADEASRDERLEGERARDYYDGKHYTAEELAILAERKQPPTTLNRIARKINHLSGIEVDRRTDPKALPRTTQHEQAAEVATDALRFVEERTDLDEKFSELHENMLIEGFGGVELGIREKQTTNGYEYEITAAHWDWEKLFYDPHSVKHDFSDSKYHGGVEWIDQPEAKRIWSNKQEIIENAGTTPAAGSVTDEYQDEPEKKVWITRGSRPRIRVVHMYYWDKGEWYLVQFTGSGVLYQEKVPFVDEEGNSWCPLRLQSAYVDRDGDRYGEVRNLISPQDMINKAHSKLQHLTSVRQIIAEEGAFSEKEGGIDQARQELAKPDGVIVRNRGYEFEISSTADMVAGHSGLLQEYKNEIDLMGPNASMQGKGPQSQSGRALIAQAEGGLREFTPLSDRFTSLKKRVYNDVWMLIRQYWTYPKWVRVTDNEEKVRFSGLNQPKTRLEIAEKRLKERGATPEEINLIRQEINANPIMKFASQEIGEIENDVTQTEVDISIEVGPDLASLQTEQFDRLASLAPAAASAGQPIPIKTLIRASQLRDKEKILEELDSGGNEEPTPQEQAALQQRQALQERQVELEFAKAEADIQKVQSEAAKNAAQAQAAVTEDNTDSIEQVKIQKDYELELVKLDSQERMKKLEIASKAEIEAIKARAQESETTENELLEIAKELRAGAEASNRPKYFIRDENKQIIGVGPG